MINTTINENTDVLELQTSELKVPYLPLSMIFLAFLMSHSSTTKGHAGSEKNIVQFCSKILIWEGTKLDKNSM